MAITGNVSESQTEKLAREWIRLLDRYHFDWFFTGTFRDSVHPEKADKIWQRYTNNLNKSLYGRRWMNKPHCGIYWAKASERQRRGVLHFHALLGDWNNLDHQARRLSWMDKWNDMAGFAKIERVLDETAVRRYLSKYVVKDGEIDLSVNLRNYDRYISMFRRH